MQEVIQALDALRNRWELLSPSEQLKIAKHWRHWLAFGYVNGVFYFEDFQKLLQMLDDIAH